MLFILAIIGTLFLGFYIYLLFIITVDDWKVAAYAKIFDNMEKIKKLEVSYSEAEKPSKEKKLAKAIQALQTQNERISQGELKYIPLVFMPGYVLQRKYSSVGRGNFYRKLYESVSEYYGRKYAAQKTAQVFATLLSLPILGVGLSFLLSAYAIGGGNKGGIVLAIVGILVVLILTYTFYDEVAGKARRRREQIEIHFPSMLSKFALLVTSGMTISRTWKEVAYSEHTPLYKEMQMTSQELENLVSPEEAYGNFVGRCNTKQTTKFAASIMQSMEKGNAEIAVLVRGMAKEAWQERKHGAKKNAEKANGKLLIPTFLLFITILFIILAPMMTSFSSF